MAESALGQLWINLGLKSTVQKDASGVTAELNNVDKTATNLQNRFSTLGSSMTSVGAGMTAGVTVPIVGAGLAIAGVAKEGMSFEKGMTQVFTLLPDMSQSAFQQMQTDTLQFSKDMKVPSEEVIPALYDAIGSGVPEDNVFSFLETSQKGAVAGATNVGVAVDTLTSLINAYGAENLNAADASDILFTGINVGKMSFEELQKSLYEVVPTAASLNVPLTDVTAALATMTAQGTPTTVATAQLRQMLVELSKEGSGAAETFTQIAGKSFPQFIKEGGSLEQAVTLLGEGFMKTSPQAQELQDKMYELADPTSSLAQEFEALTGKSFKDFQKEGGTSQQALEMLGLKFDDANGRISDTFGSIEAGNAVLQLTGKGANLFTQNVDAMGKSAGATDAAYKKMSETTDRAYEEMVADIKNATTEMGRSFLPVIKDTLVPVVTGTLIPAFEKAIGIVSKGAEVFNKLQQPVKLGALAFIALLAALGPILVIAGAVASGIGAIGALFATGGLLAGAAGIVGSIGAAILTLINPITLAIAAAILLYEAFTHWDQIEGIVNNVLTTVRNFVSNAITRIRDFFTQINYRQLGQDLMNRLLDGLEAVLPVLISVVVTTFTGLPRLITSINLYQVGVTVLSTLRDGMVFVLGALGGIVVGALSAIASRLASTSWGSAGIAIWNSFTAGVRSVLQGPYDAVMGAINTIRTFLSGINLTSIGTTIWNTFLAGIRAVLQGPYTAITGAIAAILTFLSGINLSSIGQALWNTFLAGIRLVLNGPLTAITGAINAIRSFLTGTNYSSQGSGVWNTFLAGIRAVIQGPYNLILGAINAIRSFLAGINYSSQGTNIWNTFLAGIRAVLQGPYNAIVGAINTIRSYLSGISLSSAGSAMINSLRDGIVSAFSSLLSTARGYVSDLTSILSGAQSTYDRLVSLATGSRSASSEVVSNASRAVSMAASVPSGNQAWHSGLNNPNATDFAIGGIVTKPIYAHIGEAGPEAILPLDKIPEIFQLDKLVSETIGKQSPSSIKGNGTQVTIHNDNSVVFNNVTVNSKADVDYLMKEIERKQKAKGWQKGAFS